MQTPIRPIEDQGLPEETVYADDVDYFSFSKRALEEKEQKVPPTIGEFHLNANQDKWERCFVTHEKDSTDSAGWRRAKKLGSLLGDEEDVNRRMALATVQFKSLVKLWDRPQCASLPSRMRAYNAFVLPVLMYNASTWGLSKSVEKKIEAFHRTQLRQVMGVKWPFVVSNKVLYKCCKAKPLGVTLRQLRWNLFGHVLRLSPDTPAQVAMDFYCNSVGEQKFKGRTQTTLPVLLFSEYHALKQKRKAQKSAYTQKPSVALKELRKVAKDRNEWAKLVKEVCEVFNFTTCSSNVSDEAEE